MSARTAVGHGVAHSGVQQSIFSWSAAMPSSAPAIVQLSDGAAFAAPGLPIKDSAIKMATISFTTVSIYLCQSLRKPTIQPRELKRTSASTHELGRSPPYRSNNVERPETLQ